MSHATDIESGDRFSFGENWRRFLDHLTEERVATAAASLRSDLGVATLEGKSFLDIGCGSGLFSLAARRLGARVHSFDYDPASVGCALELRRRYYPEDPTWTVEQGSALDRHYLEGLGPHDIVYSWGVLHHTGDMWTALENAIIPVAPEGLLFIAIYNDCGAESLKWHGLKKRYNSLPAFLRPAFAAAAIFPYEAKDAIKAALEFRPGDYVRSWTRYDTRRGMSRWHDIVDWVGGFPYEYASSSDLLEFFAARGFEPRVVKEAGGLGCHELVLRRTS